MLRVGLTGSLGSGKSTVAAMLRDMGAHVIEADELGRTLMEPGQAIYSEIVRVFGPEVVGADGRLNRPRLAALAFNQGRLQDLNAIVHPAVINEQRRWMDDLFAREPQAIAVVESALIFEVERDARARGENDGILADWRSRFDSILVLTAPDEVKIARYVSRVCADNADPACVNAAAADARLRLSRQMPDAEKAARADFVLDNCDGIEPLRTQVLAVWQHLQARNNKSPLPGSLK